MNWEGSAIFSILLRRVLKHVATKGHRIRPRHIYPRFFYWIQLVVLLDVTGFFATRSGRRRVHAHSICDATCTSENKWDVSDIFIRSIRFLEIVLVRLRNEKPVISHFFIRYIRFVLIRNLFLFEDPR